jgi:hypothetical protein
MHRALSLIKLVTAAIAVPRTTVASRNATAAAMAAHIRLPADVIEAHHAEHAQWPPDASRGQRPAVLSKRLRRSDFGSAPAGGQYAWQNRSGFKHPLGGCIMGISGTIDHRELIRRVEAILDDGHLATGRFVRHHKSTSIGAGPWAGYRIFSA